MKAKVYKFQAMDTRRPSKRAKTAIAGDDFQQQVMEELAALREQISQPQGAVVQGMVQGTPTQTVAQGPVEADDDEAKSAPSFGAEIQEALKLKRELDRIYTAITETKKEIASLSNVGFESGARPVDELDAVVKGTESATNQILESIEKVEEGANHLAETLTGDAGVIASTMQDQIVSVYEACNFQDITGQRITKVVNVLRFISERTESMIEIWGGMDSFSEVEGENHKDLTGDKALLNGPALNQEEASSQDDIDALFA